MPVSKSKRKRKGRPQRPAAVQTPPKRRKASRWVPIVFFTCMAAGVIVIVLNYMQIFGGQVRNELLFVGLGLMGVAFAVSTRWY